MFRRRRSEQPAPDEVLEPESTSAPDSAVEAVAAPGASLSGFDRSDGPYDLDEVPDDGLTRLDLGGLQVPGVDGMELRLEVDEAADQVVAVTIVHGDSAVQLTVFAAPRSDGIWDDVRGEIRAGLASQGLVEEAPGEFGTELHASLPLTGPDGRSLMQPVRFVGVDGPRWFLRGLFSGAGARESAAAAPLEAVLRASVVVRGNEAMAPGDPLPLHVPTAVPEGITRKEDGTEGRPTLPPPERGPEITEIR